MELVLVIIAIVYSIWSEVNKKKEEKNLDFDFSELSSIDDFLKKEKKEPSSDYVPLSEQSSRQEKKSRRHPQKSQRSDLAPAEQSGFSDSLPPAPLPMGNPSRYDDLPSPASSSSSRHNVAPGLAAQLFTSEPSREYDVKIDRNSLIKAFIVSEVMTRYDINRIYERIPGVRKDDE